MFEAPAFAFALIAVSFVATMLYRIAGGAPSVVEAIELAHGAMIAIGYAEVRARTIGAARHLATLAIVLAIASGVTFAAYEWAGGAVEVPAWSSFVATTVGIAALVGGAGRRHVLIGLVAVAAHLLSHPMPPLQTWLRETIDWKAIAAASWSLLALRTLLAWLATRDRRAPTRRRPFGPVAIAAVIVALAQLVAGSIVDAATWYVLAIAVWRLARVVSAPLALTASGIAWFAASLIALDRFAYLDVPANPGAIAFALVVIAIALRVRTRDFVALAVVVAALAVGAMAVGAPCVIAAGVVTAFALVRAGRTLATTPEPTVAEVFA
jgi:hypothetical protein